MPTTAEATALAVAPLLVALAARCWLIARMRPVLRELVRAGCCQGCGYMLQGRTTAGPVACPECGRENPPDAELDRQRFLLGLDSRSAARRSDTRPL